MSLTHCGLLLYELLNAPEPMTPLTVVCMLQLDLIFDTGNLGVSDPCSSHHRADYVAALQPKTPDLWIRCSKLAL